MPRKATNLFKINLLLFCLQPYQSQGVNIENAVLESGIVRLSRVAKTFCSKIAH